jgi:hypothetical protein
MQTKPSVEQDFDTFAELLREQKERDAQAALDAEFRFCVNRIISETFTLKTRQWTEVLGLYRMMTQGNQNHPCNYQHGNCMCLETGQAFNDPVTGKGYVATGELVVCPECLRRHMCKKHEPCEFTELTPDGHQVCSMTSFNKGVLVVSACRNAPREIVQQVSVHTFSVAKESVIASSSSGGGNKRAAPVVSAADQRRKRLASARRRGSGGGGATEKNGALAPQEHLVKELASLCGTLFGRTPECDGIAAACTKALRLAYAAFLAQVDALRAKRVPLDFCTLLALLAYRTATPLAAVLTIEPLIANGALLPQQDIDYVARAAATILCMLRGSPCIIKGDNAISAQGPRTEQTLVYVLRAMQRGVIGRIHRRLKDARIDDIELVDQDTDAREAMIEPRPGMLVETHVFVPQHPFLRYVLPHDIALAAPDERARQVCELFTHQLRTERSANVIFQSIMKEDTANIEQSCLASLMTVNTAVCAALLSKAAAVADTSRK